MTSDIILGTLFGGIVAAGIFMFLQRRHQKETLSESIAQALSELVPKHMQDAREQLIQLAEERLGGERKIISTDLENKRKAIEKLIEQVQLELRDSDKTSQSILQQIKSQQEQTEKLGKTADNLRKVLTNNQMRGHFGEQIAEDLLKMAGFVKGIDFDANKATGVGKSRPDFTVYMPDKTKINIDVKFPYKNLMAYQETEDEQAKIQLMKQFAIDVKEKVRQVTTRDYINPEDKTVDFVILFVPNEMVFSYIYERLHDVWEDAMRRKVVLAGPFSFTAILRMVRQAYENFRYQENIQEIVGLIRQFEKQYDLYSEEVEKLGSQIQTVSNTYQKVESTRAKQLTRIVEKIKLESGDDEPKPLLETSDSQSL